MGDRRGQNQRRGINMKRFNPYKLFTGSFIPNCLLQYKGLSPLAKLVWARLAQYAGENGYCYPSLETLASELGASKKGIHKAIKDLEKQGFIERELPQGIDKLTHKTTRYYFLLHPVFESSGVQQSSISEGNKVLLRSGTKYNSKERESVERESERKEKNISNVNHISNSNREIPKVKYFFIKEKENKRNNNKSSLVINANSRAPTQKDFCTIAETLKELFCV
jgi:biotin operon repressor